MLTGIVSYLRRRINERSTYLQLAAAVSAAFIVPYPYCLWSLGFSLIGIFMADGEVKQPKE